jgi:predicted MFS family arabinose efflux permease
VLTQAINWHWIFFVNVPIGLATAAFALRLLPAEPRQQVGHGADVLGGALITAALMLGVYTIVKPAAESGWGATPTLALGGLSLLLAGAFVARQATASNPLVPLRIFRSRNVSGANLIQVLSVAGMFGMFFLGSLYLERVLGYDALELGLAVLPVTLVMGTLSVRFSEPLITRFGARAMVVPGLALIAAGLAWFARVPVDGSYVADVLPTMVLIGAGAGLTFPALMTIAMSGATPSDAGLASGLVNTTVQVGGALGLAVLATLSATRTEHLAADGASTASALTGGYRLAFAIAALLVAAAVVIALTVLRSDRPAGAPAEHPPHGLELAGAEA